MKVKKAAILLVDDDKNDQFLFQSAIKKIEVQIPIHIANNGMEAIAYLDGEGEFADRERFPFPTTIITDLKMPIADGFAVLDHVKRNPKWAIVPTVVLSASTDLDDIKRAYLLGACAYHVKPPHTGELRQLLKLLFDYWVTCEIPETDEAGQQAPTQSEGKLGERFAKR